LDLGDRQAYNVPFGLGYVHIIEFYLNGLYACVSRHEAFINKQKPERQNIVAEGDGFIFTNKPFVIGRFVYRFTSKVSRARRTELKLRERVEVIEDKVKEFGR